MRSPKQKTPLPGPNPTFAPPAAKQATIPTDSLHEVREFAGHADIRTTEVYFIRMEEDAEVAAWKIQIRLTGRKGECP
jgi:hypothetical protein